MSKRTGKKYNSSPRQLENLKKNNFANRDPAEVRAIASKGGKNSAARRRERREAAETFKTAVKWLMKRPVGKTENEIVQELKAEFPDLNNLEAMTAAVMAKANNDGDYKAFTTLRDTTGELPEQTVNLRNEEPMVINIKTVE